MKLYLDYQLADDVSTESLPDQATMKKWVSEALQKAQIEKTKLELTVRVVTEPEIVALNEKYRHQQGSTNVLSFPLEEPEGVAPDLLGDVVICAAVVEREASEQTKPLMAHWAHMAVHGVLHLLGYDHIDESQARQMEGLETSILTGLGYKDPYQPVE